MGTNDSFAASADDERDISINQLIKIDGVAKKTAEAMYAIGIHSYDDLAQYLRQHTAEEISQALKEHGLNRPPGLINRQAWTRQAELFAQSEKATITSTEEEVKREKSPGEVPLGRETQDHDAVFTVFFDVERDEAGKPLLCTTIYDEKNAGKEKTFRGTDTSLWVNWILERSNLPPDLKPFETESKAAKVLPLEETGDVIRAIPAEPYDVQVKISDVQISTIERSATAVENTLKAEISFHISGADAEALTSQGLLYRVEIFTIDFGKGTPKAVASREDLLEPHRYDYRQQFEFAMPDLGRYEFHSVIRMPPTGELMGYHQGPTLKVIP